MLPLSLLALPPSLLELSAVVAAQRSSDDGDDDVSDSVVSKTLHCSDVARPRYSDADADNDDDDDVADAFSVTRDNNKSKNNKSNNNNSSEQQLLSKLIGFKVK